MGGFRLPPEYAILENPMSLDMGFCPDSVIVILLAVYNPFISYYTR